MPNKRSLCVDRHPSEVRGPEKHYRCFSAIFTHFWPIFAYFEGNIPQESAGYAHVFEQGCLFRTYYTVLSCKHHLAAGETPPNFYTVFSYISQGTFQYCDLILVTRHASEDASEFHMSLRPTSPKVAPFWSHKKQLFWKMLKCLCRCQALYAESQVQKASYGIHFLFLLAFTRCIRHDTWSRQLFYIRCNNDQANFDCTCVIMSRCVVGFI